jgi:uroporphyrinogen decarboxylase
MTKAEHVQKVLAGDTVDRPPISFWYHFGVQFREPEKIADVALAFFRFYDLDWLKMMNDFYYPLPEGSLGLSSIDDLKKLRPLAVAQTDWARQLKALEIVKRELQDKAFFLDTVFEPWQALRRSVVGGRRLLQLAEEEPQALMDALEIVTQNLISYCRLSLTAGAAGIFMSTLASRDQLTAEIYRKFAKPFAAKVFEAIRNDAPMNTAHIHGHSIYMEDALEFPVSVFSFEDRIETNPSLADMKARSSRCVMGGIDRTYFASATPAEAAAHVREGMESGGTQRFFLANGCSIAPEYSHRVLKTVVETCRAGL